MSLQKKGFMPYTLVVFINAFVDLGHKIVIQNTIFKSYDGEQQVVLTAIVNGLILLPFILLFSPSGYLADRFAKHRIIRYSALFAVIATLLITFCYYQGWFWASFGLTFALAVQSAIYSPAKYGYIKELVGNEKLAAANGQVQAVTISGILLGTFVFSILFEKLLAGHELGSTGDTMSLVAPIGWVLVALSLVEWFSTSFLPDRQTTRTEEVFRLAPYIKLQYLGNNLKVLWHNNTIWLSIIGLATFWAISQVMLAAFPAFAKDSLDITNTIVIQGVLACSGIGIVIGSLIAGKASKNYIETGLIPIGALGIAIGIAVLPSLGSAVGMGVAFTLVGVMGGMFIVPLNSLIQFHAREEQIGTILAGNNWIQNVAMLGALILTVVFALFGIDSVGLFYILTAVAIIGTGYTVRKLPHSLVRIIATGVLKRRYRVEVIGFDNIPQAGPTLMLGNHISWIDWALVQIACPRPLRFVMLDKIYNTWYLKPFFKAVGAVPIAAGRSQDSLKEINQLLQHGECVCLFPEGAISRNGQLGKFHSGYERTIDGVIDGLIVPFYLRGLWGSSFSRADEGLRTARTPESRRDLIVAFGPPLPLTTNTKNLKQKVFELSLDAWHAYSDYLEPVPKAWLRAARRHPWTVSCGDNAGDRLSNLEMVGEVVACARVMPVDKSSPHVGILLPAGTAAAVTTLAIQLRGGVAVHLDYQKGLESLRSGLELAAITQLFTSREYARLMAESGIDVDALASGVAVSFIDKTRQGVPAWYASLVKALFILLPVRWFYSLYGRRLETDDHAAIVINSVADQAVQQPRAVVLTHRNIMVNIKQVADVLNTRLDDVMLSQRPPSDALGLTTQTLLPLVEGIPVACHDNPSDTLGIAKTIARNKVTILFARSSLLESLANDEVVHPLMLDSLRLVVAGLEPLPEQVRISFELKFGKKIYPGYGAAETTSLASINIPDAMSTADWKVQQGSVTGSVGLPLPGASFRVVDPASMRVLPLGSEGLVMVSGDQLTPGYLGDEGATQNVISEFDGQRWYHRGDRGYLTEEGFLVITVPL